MLTAPPQAPFPASSRAVVMDSAPILVPRMRKLRWREPGGNWREKSHLKMSLWLKT